MPFSGIIIIIIIWVKLGVMIDTTYPLHFDTTLRDLDVKSRSLGCKKAKLLWQLSCFLNLDGLWSADETF